MRPSSAAPAQEVPRPADRDREIEQRYPFERGGLSVLAFVSSNAKELAREYLDWRAAGGARDSVRGDLPAWEHSRFGAELFHTAHGLLLCAVLCLAYPDDPRARLIRGEPSEGTRKPAQSVEALSRRMQMPHGLGRKGHEARINALKEQAAE